MTVTPSPSPAPSTASAFSAVWANDGGDKVTQEELRGTTSATAVINSTWDGTKIKTFGAKNEVVAFNLVLESATRNVDQVSVSFNQLTGPGGARIQTTGSPGAFNWVNRNIELFHVRYLQIKGLSLLSYDNYDERHIPKRFQRPWTGTGLGSGNWLSRPDHDKFYPDIAVPMEIVPTFTVATGKNQSIWADIYVPKTAPAGVYTGNVTISVNGVVNRTVPVELRVRNFTLPDVPTSKTMVYMGYGDINQRYLGNTWPNPGTAADIASKEIRSKHFKMAHRHKISMIDSNPGADVWNNDRPRPEWIPRLDGSLFTAANNYDGPGVNTGNGIYSIHTYGTWKNSWGTPSQSSMNTHMDAWENWFRTNSPSTERFLYLIDESTDYAQTEQWASWAKTGSGVGTSLKTFATTHLVPSITQIPSLSIIASWFAVAPKDAWEAASQTMQSTAGRQFYIYNGKRPASGSFATEDDGVALRQLPWGQYKKGIHRWFFWESTYYNDYQSGRGQTNVFNSAVTFGGASTNNANLGESGWNHSNGDGVLFYPGTDTLFPASSLGLDGPIASLRLKQWRRGIQDVDYLEMARAINPVRVSQIIDRMIAKVLWENGVAQASDPTWQRCDISWSTNPDIWEQARLELADIIDP